MTYIKKGEWVCDNQIYAPPVEFSMSTLAIKAEHPNVRTTWNKAADIYQFINIPSIGKILHPKRNYLPLNRLVEINFAVAATDYGIQIEFPIWINPIDITLTIYESDMATFSEFTPAVQTTEFSNKLNTAIAASTTLTNVAANTLRRGLYIRNRGNQTVYVGLNDTALTANTASFAIIGGDTFEMVDDVWTGILHFLTASGTTNLVVTELL